MVKVTHNGPDDIVLFKTGIDLDMSRSSNQNALSEMNDNYLIQGDYICLHGQNGPVIAMADFVTKLS